MYSWFWLDRRPGTVALNAATSACEKGGMILSTASQRMTTSQAIDFPLAPQWFTQSFKGANGSMQNNSFGMDRRILAVTRTLDSSATKLRRLQDFVLMPLVSLRPPVLARKDGIKPRAPHVAHSSVENDVFPFVFSFSSSPSL